MSDALSHANDSILSIEPRPISDRTSEALFADACQPTMIRATDFVSQATNLVPKLDITQNGALDLTEVLVASTSKDLSCSERQIANVLRNNFDFLKQESSGPEITAAGLGKTQDLVLGHKPPRVTLGGAFATAGWGAMSGVTGFIVGSIVTDAVFDAAVGIAAATAAGAVVGVGIGVAVPAVLLYSYYHGSKHGFEPPARKYLTDIHADPEVINAYSDR